MPPERVPLHPAPEIKTTTTTPERLAEADQRIQEIQQNSIQPAEIFLTTHAVDLQETTIGLQEVQQRLNKDKENILRLIAELKSALTTVQSFLEEYQKNSERLRKETPITQAINGLQEKILMLGAKEKRINALLFLLHEPQQGDAFFCSPNSFFGKETTMCMIKERQSDYLILNVEEAELQNLAQHGRKKTTTKKNSYF